MHSALQNEIQRIINELKKIPRGKDAQSSKIYMIHNEDLAINAVRKTLEENKDQFNHHNDLKRILTFYTEVLNHRYKEIDQLAASSRAKPTGPVMSYELAENIDAYVKNLSKLYFEANCYLVNPANSTPFPNLEQAFNHMLDKIKLYQKQAQARKIPNPPFVKKDENMSDAAASERSTHQLRRSQPYRSSIDDEKLPKVYARSKEEILYDIRQESMAPHSIGGEPIHLSQLESDAKKTRRELDPHQSLSFHELIQNASIEQKNALLKSELIKLDALLNFNKAKQYRTKDNYTADAKAIIAHMQKTGQLIVMSDWTKEEKKIAYTFLNEIYEIFEDHGWPRGFKAYDEKDFQRFLFTLEGLALDSSPYSNPHQSIKNLLHFYNRKHAINLDKEEKHPQANDDDSQAANAQDPLTTLVDEIKSGRSQHFEKIIIENPDISYKPLKNHHHPMDDNFTPLMYAAKYAKQKETIHSLLFHLDNQQKSNVIKSSIKSAINPFRGWTISMVAAHWGSHLVLKEILESTRKSDRKSIVNMSVRSQGSMQGYTALLAACVSIAHTEEEKQNKLLKVQLLLAPDNGADINAQIKVPPFSNAFACAISTGHIELVRLLIEKGARIDLANVDYELALKQSLLNDREKNTIRHLLRLTSSPAAVSSSAQQPLASKSQSKPKQRVTLFQENPNPALLSTLTNYLDSQELEVGAAISKGDCFYDAVAQALEKANIAIPCDPAHANAAGYKKIRLLCHAEMQKLHQQNPDNWVKTINHREGPNAHQKYLNSVQYSADEIDGSPVWGLVELDGRLICQALSIKIHLLELHRNAPTLLHNLVDNEGVRSLSDQNQLFAHANTLHIVNAEGSLHFVPFFKSSIATNQATAAAATKESKLSLSGQKRIRALEIDISEKTCLPASPRFFNRPAALAATVISRTTIIPSPSNASPVMAQVITASSSSQAEAPKNKKARSKRTAQSITQHIHISITHNTHATPTAAAAAAATAPSRPCAFASEAQSPLMSQALAAHRSEAIMDIEPLSPFQIGSIDFSELTAEQSHLNDATSAYNPYYFSPINTPGQTSLEALESLDDEDENIMEFFN